MGKDQENKEGWLDRMRESYKLIVYRTEDFSEVRRFDLSVGSIYTAISMLFVLMIVLFTVLLVFTPIKKMVPGYGKIEANEEFIQLIDQVNQLSHKVEAQETYLKGMRNILTAATTDETTAQSDEQPTSKISAASLSEPVAPSTPEAVAAKHQLPTTDERAMLFNSMKSADIIKPVDGVISSEFQPAIQHYGIDILGPKNTPVKAMMDGYVFTSGWDLETGYTIGVQHKGNILTFYKHNSTLLKEKGSFVRAGEAIAIIGNTGTLSSGPHLHFELWHNGKPVNPKDIINF